MANDFINWDDLDLDDVLGENYWTDADEQNDILGSEQEWFSSDNDSFPPVPEVQPSTANGNAENHDDKENRIPNLEAVKITNVHYVRKSTLQLLDFEVML